MLPKIAHVTKNCKSTFEKHQNDVFSGCSSTKTFPKRELINFIDSQENKGSKNFHCLEKNHF